jgi:hypothetical protein
MSDDFFIRLERQLAAAELRELNRGPVLRRFVGARRFLSPRRLLSVPLAAAAAVGVVVVALVAVWVTVARESDVERPAEPPGKKLVATDVENGVRFSLDGRVLTVQLLPNRPNATFEAVSGAEISATCRTNVVAAPGDPRGQSTVFRVWPAGETSLSFRFARDVMSWCRLDRPSVGIVASVSFPVAWSGARGPIAETADKWARHFASSPQTCTDYMTRSFCEGVKGCEPGLSIRACRAKARRWGAEFLGATAQRIAVEGDRAAATLSNAVIVQLRRTTTGEWLIDGMGPFGAVGPDAAAQRREHRGP